MKNTASALEVIWLQCWRPSQLKGEVLEAEVNAENELPDVRTAGAGADILGEDMATVGEDVF